MIRQRTSHRRGFTLVELTLSMAVTTVLLGGMASAMVLASRALPDNQSVLSATLDGSRCVEQLAGELFGADAFTERSASAVQFTVPDRNADTVPETIRYSWSGAPGDPLVREYNGVGSTAIPDVHGFALSYLLQTVTATVETGGAPVVVTTEYVTQIDVALRVGPDEVTRVQTGIRVINAPLVNGP